MNAERGADGKEDYRRWDLMPICYGSTQIYMSYHPNLLCALSVRFAANGSTSHTHLTRADPLGSCMGAPFSPWQRIGVGAMEMGTKLRDGVSGQTGNGMCDLANMLHVRDGMSVKDRAYVWTLTYSNDQLDDLCARTDLPIPLSSVVTHGTPKSPRGSGIITVWQRS